MLDDPATEVRIDKPPLRTPNCLAQTVVGNSLTKLWAFCTLPRISEMRKTVGLDGEPITTLPFVVMPAHLGSDGSGALAAIVQLHQASFSAKRFPVDPHMLRHAMGFYLANAGNDTRAIQLYLGHKNIQHTVRYTELSRQRFMDFWQG